MARWGNCVTCGNVMAACATSGSWHGSIVSTCLVRWCPRGLVGSGPRFVLAVLKVAAVSSPTNCKQVQNAVRAPRQYVGYGDLLIMQGSCIGQHSGLLLGLQREPMMPSVDLQKVFFPSGDAPPEPKNLHVELSCGGFDLFRTDNAALPLPHCSKAPSAPLLRCTWLRPDRTYLHKIFFKIVNLV